MSWKAERADVMLSDAEYPHASQDMMEPNPARQPRKVAIADHIWTAFEEMAQQMGADRDGLINQAMFMFARLNGFIETNGNAPANGAPARGPAAKSAPPVLSPVPSKPPPVERERDEPAPRSSRVPS